MVNLILLEDSISSNETQEESSECRLHYQVKVSCSNNLDLEQLSLALMSKLIISMSVSESLSNKVYKENNLKLCSNFDYLLSCVIFKSWIVNSSNLEIFLFSKFWCKDQVGFIFLHILFFLS